MQMLKEFWIRQGTICKNKKIMLLPSVKCSSKFSIGAESRQMNRKIKQYCFRCM